VREFSTGATRDDAEGKIDPEGALSPLVIERFCQYMREHETQADGAHRSSDNWQKGIPLKEYMKSMWRHLLQVWKMSRGWVSGNIEEALCALMFNVHGYLHETLKLKDKQNVTAYPPSKVIFCPPVREQEEEKCLCGEAFCRAPVKMVDGVFQNVQQ
jgi:hypothetical protein